MNALMSKFERKIFTSLLATLFIVFSILTSAIASQHAGFMVNLAANDISICITDLGDSDYPLDNSSDINCSAMCSAANSIGHAHSAHPPMLLGILYLTNPNIILPTSLLPKLHTFLHHAPPRAPPLA